MNLAEPSPRRLHLPGHLDAVVRLGQEHGAPAVTLTTFRDIPFNAPWYRARGFVALDAAEWGPELRRLWQEEDDAGVGVAPRIAMRRTLTTPTA